jgi:hypothetical protein
LHSTKWSNGKKKNGWKSLSSKNNLIHNSEGNEENRYPVPDPKKKMINNTKEHSNAHKYSLKEEILQEITENFMEKMLDMANQNLQDALKKFQDTKNKEHEKTQKQKNELKCTLNKC